MDNINKAAPACDKIPQNDTGEGLGKLTLNLFQRGVTQHRFVTRKIRCPLDVFEWWGWVGKKFMT